jgi:ABC-type transport system involved in cytochrome c biogenesis permease subunit
MVLVELAFIMLWTGLVMGAIWADHSWGRPWGWDPKEVFALNTFLIFLVLLHVRLKVRDKAFWTAILAVVGFEVMMFNWIVVNFVISGLHSCVVQTSKQKSNVKTSQSRRAITRR